MANSPIASAPNAAPQSVYLAPANLQPTAPAYTATVLGGLSQAADTPAPSQSDHIMLAGRYPAPQSNPHMSALEMYYQQRGLGEAAMENDRAKNLGIGAAIGATGLLVIGGAICGIVALRHGHGGKITAGTTRPVAPPAPRP